MLLSFLDFPIYFYLYNKNLDFDHFHKNGFSLLSVDPTESVTYGTFCAYFYPLDFGKR